jgi:hypothetical protein
LKAQPQSRKAATGVTVESFNPRFDEYFAANGYRLPRTYFIVLAALK